MNGLTINDLVNLVNVGDLKTNGQHTVFVTAQPDANQLKQYQWSVYHQLGDHQQLLFSVDQHPGLTLSNHPTNYLYYSTMDNHKKATRLHQFNLLTMSEEQTFKLKDRQLKVEFELNKHELIMSGTYHVNQPVTEPWHEVSEVPYWSNGEGAVNNTRHHLWKFNLITKTLQDLVPTNFDVANFWYQDHRLLISGVSYRKSRPFKDGLYEYNFDRQQLLDLISPGQYRFDDVAVLNHRLFAVASDGKRFGMGENPKFYAYQDHALMLVANWDREFGNIVVNDMTVVGGNSASVSHDQLFFYATVTDHNEFFKFDGHTVTKLFKWNGAINSFAITKTSILFTATTAEQPQQLYRYQADKFEKLSHFNSFLKQRQVAHFHELHYLDSTGKSAVGWLLKPTNYQSDKKYPAVLEIHGGPRAAYGHSFFHEMQVLANHGYFVFFTNIHGSAGQGNKYADLRGKYGQVDYDDLMAFTDAVLNQTPAIDPQRLGVTGGSYGGFMTNWIVGHTNRFNAAVSERSIASWSSMMISDIGPEFVPDQMGMDLLGQQGMDKYWWHSPLRYVNRVQTPTLFLHSDHDFRCPVVEGYQMFQAVKLQHQPTKMLVFHGSNHNLSRNGRPDQRMQRLREVLTWFNQYLNNHKEGE
ncbi:S9 family peptidase [uncultured Limosilactobacillus sp.]|uniref:alpha/beta hydrolase family protein n=1 Tax=uncultured Limosilactobacillus sp. TaxID=2837629 RepID=UPI0025CF9CC1|nr:S9 family peptidase [uncultured Limosilactobacillus sp.]